MLKVYCPSSKLLLASWAAHHRFLCSGSVQDLLEELLSGKHIRWSRTKPHEGHLLAVKLHHLLGICGLSSWHETWMIVLVVIPRADEFEFGVVVDRAGLCSTWVEHLDVAISGERVESDGAVGVELVGAVLPDERCLEAAVGDGVRGELIARLLEEAVVSERVGDAGSGWEGELLSDRVEEFETSSDVLRARRPSAHDGCDVLEGELSRCQRGDS